MHKQVMANFMNRFLQIILSLSCFLTFGQELSKKEFNQIYLETGKIREFIMTGRVDALGENLNILNLSNFKELEKVFVQDKINFNGKSEHTYAQPYFYLTDQENVLEITIPGMKILEQLNGEEFQRGKYYFVLKTNAEFNRDKKEVEFKNSTLITSENGIEKWWIGQWKNYMPEVVKISDKYGFIPPPPPCPPENLK